MIHTRDLRAMRMLAKLEGGYLHIDRYGPSVAARLEKTNFPVEASELQKLLRILESDGMVASIFERLDGLLYALTAKGRAVMEAEGFIFNAAEVAKTRTLFEGWQCKEPM